MNDMTPENPDSAATAQAVDAAEAAPKRRRTRKADAAPAVAEAAASAAVALAAEPVAAPAAEPAAVPAAEVPARPRRSRKAAAATALPVGDAVTTAAPVAVAAVVEAPAEAPAEPAVAAPAKRAPRARKKVVAAAQADVPADPVPEEAPADARPQASTPVLPAAERPAAVEASSGEAAGEAAAVESGAATESARSTESAEAAEGAGPRRRERGRRRGRRGEGAERGDAEPGGEAAASAESVAAEKPLFTLGEAPAQPAGPALSSVDARSRFDDVLTGSYDQEGDAVVDEEPGKRVLRPEPEAPKLHKVLAQSGIGSRRDMEQLIEQGQITVNGEVAHVGMRIARGDVVKVAGRQVKLRIAPPPARVIAYHKPTGEVVTHHDPEGRPTVFRHLPRLPAGKWLSVGRLDINTEGLLLFTNSGELANQLMHPRFGVEREYAVRVLGTLDEAARERLLTGVEIEGQSAAFKSIEDGGGEGANHWYRVVITEGRNREVRKLFDSVGMAVSRLIRIRYGTVVLPRGLKRGVWVELDDDDVRQIRRLAGNEAPGRGERGDRPERAERGERGERAERGERGERGEKTARGRGAQHGGGMPKGAQGPGAAGGQPGKGPGKQRGKGGGKFGNGPERDGRDVREAREPREVRGDDEDDDIPLRIPNPLEQTFDRRFATGSKRIVSGFGRPMDEDRGGPAQRKKGEPRQPDPMQTSVGYIGADAYFTRPGGSGKNRGGRRR
ncbi:MAG: rRNA pseudouridine synthase [Burkholderiaceae bacterium]|nr:rRNA pseudouridine synthase [Burkholderiaceae bacterium]